MVGLSIYKPGYSNGWMVYGVKSQNDKLTENLF
jgi:hypothetical protein